MLDPVLRKHLSQVFSSLRHDGYRVVSAPRVRQLLELRLGHKCEGFAKTAVTTEGCHALILTAECHGVPHFVLTHKIPAELLKRGWPEFKEN